MGTPLSVNPYVEVLSKNATIILWVILVAAASLGFYRVEMIAQRQEDEAFDRARVICEITNDNRQLLVEILSVTDPEVVGDFIGRLQPVSCEQPVGANRRTATTP
jgi:hypothetical protein